MSVTRRGDDQLRLLVGDATDDLAWMRVEVDRRKLSNVTDDHLGRLYQLADGDREIVVAAVASVCAGRPYDPLRRRIEAKRGA